MHGNIILSSQFIFCASTGESVDNKQQVYSIPEGLVDKSELRYHLGYNSAGANPIPVLILAILRILGLPVYPALYAQVNSSISSFYTPPMSTKSFTGVLFNGMEFSTVEDSITVEVPLRIVVNGDPFMVTMQTPGHEMELIRGLLFTENIFRDLIRNPLMKVRLIDGKGYISAVDVQLPDELILREFAGSRNGFSVSSCGLCGKTSLDDFNSEPVSNPETLDPLLVSKMFRQLKKSQVDFQKTGGTHAAGAFSISGSLLALREDIGRHNAVDKVIGALIEGGVLDKAKCLVVSSRISYEIVVKARSAGIPFLAGVSAPTTLAINCARESGLTLMAFCRNHRFTIYSNPDRVVVASGQSVARTIQGRTNVT
jgi:FdhD protein